MPNGNFGLMNPEQTFRQLVPTMQNPLIQGFGETASKRMTQAGRQFTAQTGLGFDPGAGARAAGLARSQGLLGLLQGGVQAYSPLREMELGLRRQAENVQIPSSTQAFLDPFLGTPGAVSGGLDLISSLFNLGSILL